MWDKIYHMAFTKVFGIGTNRCHEAYQYYRSPKEFFTQSREGLMGDSYLRDEERRAAVAVNLKEQQLIYEQTLAEGYFVLTPQDPWFPPRLKEITPMPIVLYAAGKVELLAHDVMIGMVGTRTPNRYGIEAAKLLSEELGKLGLIVVSGLAIGIDSACHTGALQSAAPTVAVVAAGIDDPYPRQNAQLRRLIKHNGVIVSEYPLGQTPHRHHFLQRNRIISGLSRGTIVVQAAAKSGSLITAGHAMEQGRDVFAVPGSIFDKESEGCHLLLNDGAYVAYDAQFIYDTVTRYTGEIPQYNFAYNNQQEQLPIPSGGLAETRQHSSTAAQLALDNQLHQQIHSLLLQNPLHINDLCTALEIPIHRLMAELTFMEAVGLISCTAGRRYSAL